MRYFHIWFFLVSKENRGSLGLLEIIGPYGSGHDLGRPSPSVDQYLKWAQEMEGRFDGKRSDWFIALRIGPRVAAGENDQRGLLLFHDAKYSLFILLTLWIWFHSYHFINVWNKNKIYLIKSNLNSSVVGKKTTHSYLEWKRYTSSHFFL